MRVVYLGSGDIGFPALTALLDEPRHEVVAVVTQPDRPVGRHQTLGASPIKTLALARCVPVLQPERIRRPEAVEALRGLAADVFVVFAYGQILPPAVLEAPRLACLNLHASLLPRHRGAAPIQAAVLAGDAESGLSVMFMDAGLDTGGRPLRNARAVAAAGETGGSLHDLLAARLRRRRSWRRLDLLAAGRAPRKPQDAVLATYAPKLDRRSGAYRLAAGSLPHRAPNSRFASVARGVYHARGGRDAENPRGSASQALFGRARRSVARDAARAAGCGGRIPGRRACSCAKCSSKAGAANRRPPFCAAIR